MRKKNLQRLDLIFKNDLDTDFTADLTIIEEGHELLQRQKNIVKDKDVTVKIPMTTSCSSGWIKFIEHAFPEYLTNVSTAKSPPQMFVAPAKTFYANKIGVEANNMISVSIMPCTAKKYEADRPEMCSSGYKDVDYVLTTRELALMIKQAGIDFASLPDDEDDSIMGESSGAAVIFGTTGGVVEAVLCTVYEIVTGREVPFEGLNLRPVRDKKVEYHFIEIMACPGGCLGGGGQPIPTSVAIRKKRSEVIYEEDTLKLIRKSNENPEIVYIYKEFLKESLGERSHELLYTLYTSRNGY